jgi:hypothetical protein
MSLNLVGHSMVDDNMKLISITFGLESSITENRESVCNGEYLI